MFVCIVYISFQSQVVCEGSDGRQTSVNAVESKKLDDDRLQLFKSVIVLSKVSATDSYNCCIRSVNISSTLRQNQTQSGELFHCCITSTYRNKLYKLYLSLIHI